MNAGEAIPYVAWEQAVFVVLFIVFVAALLNWFSRQSEKWQQFMFDIDDKWRLFNKEQREENNCAMADVQKSLQDLTQVTQSMVVEMREVRSDTTVFFGNFQAHDAQAREILNEVKRKPKTRISKQEESNGDPS